MDRTGTCAALSCSSMCSRRTASRYLLLRAKASERHRSTFHEVSRRDLYRETILWIAKHHCDIAEKRSQCQSQADSGDHERSGVSWTTTRTADFQKSSGASQVSLPIERNNNLQTDASMEFRHHVHSPAGGVCVSYGNNGLLQSVCPFSQTLEQLGGHLLYRGFRGSGRALREAGDIQYGSRSPVLLDRICQCSLKKRDPIQHGWERKSSRQYFRRAFVEVGEV